MKVRKKNPVCMHTWTGCEQASNNYAGECKPLVIAAGSRSERLIDNAQAHMC